MFKKALADLRRLPNIDYHWVLIWGIIYITFLALDILAPNFTGTTLLKYTGIFLCLVYAHQKFRHDTLLILALLFTLLADTILVWTPYAIAGVFTFCFAQFFHTARFTKTQPKVLIGFSAGIFLAFIFAIVKGIPPIYAIAGIYGVTLITNLLLSIRWYRHEPHNFHARCALYGFILFISCDISVGLQYLTLDNHLPIAILPIVSYLVWLFYYPSQVLIANSSNLPAPQNPTKSTTKLH